MCLSIVKNLEWELIYVIGFLYKTECGQPVYVIRGGYKHD